MEPLSSDLFELLQLFADGWGLMALSAGITSGLVSRLSEDTPMTTDALAAQSGYDAEKISRWLFFMERAGLAVGDGDGYTLTRKGSLLSPHSAAKDFLGFAQLSGFYMTAAVGAKDAFKTGHGLDSLSQGKVTREYQPRVSDNFSCVILESLKEQDIQAGDTLLDIGCGTGSFIRAFIKQMPGVKLTGADSNLYAIEQGRKEIRNLGLTGQINMVVADMESDLADFQDLSYDWATSIDNIYFIAKESRLPLIDHMARIARKGFLLTIGVLDPMPAMPAANVLMSLLWNDFSGWFKPDEAEAFIKTIQRKYPRFRMRTSSILQGAGMLIIVRKP